jgi:hypothetical protein
MEGESSSEQSLDSFVDTFFENVSLDESDILSASSRGIGVRLRPKVGFLLRLDIINDHL